MTQGVSRRRLPDVLRGVVIEVLLVGGLIGAYEEARAFVGHQISAAFEHAETLWTVEQHLHLPGGATLQAPLTHNPVLAVAANVYYVGLHWPVTILALLWLVLRRPPVYRWMRRTFLLMTGAALVLYAALPVAPPRLLPDAALVDTMRTFGPSLYDDTPGKGIEDQFAAMPSLHVGWAALVAVAVILSFRSRWRWLALIYPLLTWWVVLATANHYFSDGLVALLLLAVSMWLTRPRDGRVFVPAARVSSDDAAVALDLPCPACGEQMYAEQAHNRCPACLYIEPCCDGAPQQLGCRAEPSSL